MQEIINSVLNFIPLNEYLLYGILAFFALLSIICLIIIYKPRQKMPKLAVAGNATIKESKKKKLTTKEKENATESNITHVRPTFEGDYQTENIIENIFRIEHSADCLLNSSKEQTMHGPDGTKVINLADFAVSYKPDLSKINTEPSKDEEIDTPEESKEEQAITVNEDGKKFEIVEKRSFQAKLIQSLDETKEFYAQVADYIVSFGVKNRFAWDSSLFIKDKKTLAKIAIRGKTLCLYLALLPKMFIDTKYRAKDVSATKKFEATPLMIKIKSERGVKFAKELIDEMMKSFGLSCNISFVPAITAKMYPFDTTDKLIEQGLIKLVKTEVKTFPQN